MSHENEYKGNIAKKMESRLERPDDDTLDVETVSEKELKEWIEDAVANTGPNRPADEQIIVECTLTRSRYNRQVWKRRRWSLAEMAEWCRQSITGRAFHRPLKKDGVAIVPGNIETGEDRKKTVGGDPNENYGTEGPWRQKHLVRDAEVLVFDIEDFAFGTDDPEELAEWLEARIPGVDMLLWSSWHHGLRHPTDKDGIKNREATKWQPGHPRFRLVIPLSEPVGPEAYTVLWKHVASALLEEAPDMGTGDVTRIAYAPKPQHDCARDGDPDPFVYRIDHGGETLDPENLPDGAALASLVATENRQEERREEKREERLRELEDAGVELPDPESDSARRHAIQKLKDRCGQVRNIGTDESRHNALCSITGGHIGEMVSDGMLAVDEVVDALVGSVPRIGERQGKAEWREEIRDLVVTGAELAADEGRSYDMTRVVDEADCDDGQGRPVFYRPTDRDYAKTFLDRYPNGDHLHFCRGRWWEFDPDRLSFHPVEPGRPTLHHFSQFLKEWDGAKKIDQHGNTRKLNANRRWVSDVVLAHAEDELPDDQLYDGALDGPPSIACKDGVIFVDPTKKNPMKSTSHSGTAAKLKATRYAPYSYEGADEPDHFLQILENVWGCDDDTDKKIQFFREWVGAALLGVATEYNRAVILYGSGSNGKSTILDILKAMWPDSAFSSVPVQAWGERFQLEPMLNKTLNVIEEMPSRDIVDSAAMKRVVDGIEMEIERKHQQPFSAQMEAGHIFAANNLPSVSDLSDGFWRRWTLLEFNEHFDDQNKRDFDLKEKVDLENVFGWLIRGGGRLIQRGLNQGALVDVPSSIQAKKRWKGDVSPVIDFCNKYLKPIPEHASHGDGVPNGKIWQRWKREYVPRHNAGENYKKSTVMRDIKDHFGVESKPVRHDGGRCSFLRLQWTDDWDANWGLDDDSDSVGGANVVDIPA